MAPLNYHYLKARLSIPDPYAAIGVKATCTPQDAQRAYISLARAVHPDKAADPSDEREASQRNELTGLLNAAYDSLRSVLEVGAPASTNAPRRSKTMDRDHGQADEDVRSDHPAREREDFRIDPLLFHTWRDREADDSTISDRVQRDARNLAILRQAILDDQREQQLLKLKQQAKNTRLFDERHEKAGNEAKREVTKLRKAVLRWERKSKPKHGLAYQLTSKQKNAMKEMREDLERAEATVRASEQRVKTLEAAEHAEERQGLSCGPFAGKDDLKDDLSGYTTGGSCNDLETFHPTLEVTADQEDDPMTTASPVDSDNVVGIAGCTKAFQKVDLLQAYLVDKKRWCLNAVVSAAHGLDSDSGAEESRAAVQTQWQRQSAEKRDRLEIQEAQQKQALIVALRRKQQQDSRKITLLTREAQKHVAPTGEVAKSLLEIRKRSRTNPTKGRSTNVSVSALKDSQRKADRWVYSFAVDRAFGDDEADAEHDKHGNVRTSFEYTDDDEHGNVKDSFDCAAFESLVHATEHSAQVMKNKIDTGVGHFTREFENLGLPMLHKCTPGCRAACTKQRYATKLAATAVDKWVEIAAAVPLPLPNVAELDFLAWRRVRGAVSSRMKPVRQYIHAGEGLVFPERAKIDHTCNASDYIDASRPMNLGEALVHLHEKHAYSLDFILDLPGNLQHVLVSFIAARGVIMDDTIDAMSAKWLIDRAREGRANEVAALISEQGKAFFGAITYGAGQVEKYQDSRSSRGCGREEAKGIKDQSMASW